MLLLLKLQQLLFDINGNNLTDIEIYMNNNQELNKFANKKNKIILQEMKIDEIITLNKQLFFMLNNFIQINPIQLKDQIKHIIFTPEINIYKNIIVNILDNAHTFNFTNSPNKMLNLKDIQKIIDKQHQSVYINCLLYLIYQYQFVNSNEYIVNKQLLLNTTNIITVLQILVNSPITELVIKYLSKYYVLSLHMSIYNDALLNKYIQNIITYKIINKIQINKSIFDTYTLTSEYKQNIDNFKISNLKSRTNVFKLPLKYYNVVDNINYLIDENDKKCFNIYLDNISTTNQYNEVINSLKKIINLKYISELDINDIKQILDTKYLHFYTTTNVSIEDIDKLNINTKVYNVLFYLIIICQYENLIDGIPDDIYKKLTQLLYKNKDSIQTIINYNEFNSNKNTFKITNYYNLSQLIHKYLICYDIYQYQFDVKNNNIINNNAQQIIHFNYGIRLTTKIDYLLNTILINFNKINIELLLKLDNNTIIKLQNDLKKKNKRLNDCINIDYKHIEKIITFKYKLNEQLQQIITQIINNFSEYSLYAITKEDYTLLHNVIINKNNIYVILTKELIEEQINLTSIEKYQLYLLYQIQYNNFVEGVDNEYLFQTNNIDYLRQINNNI